MSRMPVFLTLLARQVQELARSGRALYVTETTADELTLLVRLPWDEALKSFDPEPESLCVSDVAWMQTVMPSDFVHGWLRVAGMTDLHRTDEVRCLECAELAMLGAEGLALLHAAAVVTAPAAEDRAKVHRDRDRGSLEGALAVWRFVVKQWAPLFDGSWAAHAGLDGGPTHRMLRRYRAELVAMEEQQARRESP